MNERLIRTFLCCPVPLEVKSKKNMLYSTLEDSPSKINWVKNDNLHLTLKFIGYTTENQIPEIINILSKITIKYKSFLPLLWIIFCLDHFMRLLTFALHYPGSEYTTSNAPGGYIGSLVLLGITSIIFYLSLLRKKEVYGS